MPGPNGEDCGLCYYGDEKTPGHWVCRINQPDLPQPTRHKTVPVWRSVFPGVDWCGRFADRTAPVKGVSGMGSILLPAYTPWDPPSETDFTVFNPTAPPVAPGDPDRPPGFYEGKFMHNASFDPITGALSVAIPGTFGPSAVFGAAYSLWGGVVLPRQNDWLEITLGDPSGTAYQSDAIYPIGVNKQTDGLPSGFSLDNPASLAAQNVGVTILVRGLTSGAVWRSCILGLDVELQ